MYTIHNARTQMMATAVNNLGVGAILAGIVSPTVNGMVGNGSQIVLWCLLGADLIALAQLILERLRP